MRDPFEKSFAKAKPVHPYEWLWEGLATDPGFVLRSMFGGKSVYLDGKLMLYFAAKAEPWRGLLVCTDRPHHAALVADFAELHPHPILPKWLYLSESTETFERLATRLVALARRRDPRLGVMPQVKGKRLPAKGRRRPRP
ncbi:MAG: hypothetical protein WCR49_14735 [Opitutae bacterium]